MAERMSAMDAISGSLAECYVTVDGERYNFMHMTHFEGTYELSIAELPILGQVNKGHRPAGVSGSWSGTAYFNNSIFRELMKRYQNTGIFPYFDIQVTNEDPTSSVGKQSVILRDCLLDRAVIAKFDADSDYLTEDFSGTYEKFELPETFTNLTGM